MKNYPRIHSLSTLGLIHHQECDYLFHPSRTDFMGDSASGKSIIADLLQLILVGSTVFKSSTSTIKEPRDPDGLVLKTPGKGTDIAYAFINIEMADEQFITIGAYLESVNKHTKPFIIQSSIKIENNTLVPMSIPLQASDLKNGDDVYELEELPDIMDNRDLVFTKWDKFSPYHRILYYNGILPLDLTTSEKTLKDYAQIIQSFSRGKDLKTSDSGSLLNFLFGQEKSKEMNLKYIGIVKELEATVLSYGQNLESINLLDRKYQRVCKIKDLLEAMRNKNKDYLHEELLYLQCLNSRLSESISENILKFQTASSCLKQLIIAAKKDIDQAEVNKDSILGNVKTTLDVYNQAKQQYDTLAAAQALLFELSIEERLLEITHQDYQKQKGQYTIFQGLKSKLVTQKLEPFFQQSEWIKGFKLGNEYYIKRKPQIQARIEQLNRMSEYTDLGNPESLANWAVSLDRPLTRIEESLVLHFQSFARKKPDNPSPEARYLPIPETLFENKKIDENANGFWIDLDGVWEYVVYVTEQKLNTIDRSIIDEYFILQSQNIKQEVKQLQEEQENLDSINTILTDLPNVTNAITAYQQRDELEKFKEIKFLNIDFKDIQSYISALQKSDAIIRNFESVQKSIDEVSKIKSDNESLLKILPKKVNEAEKLSESALENVDLIMSLLKTFNINENLNYDLSFYHDSDNKVECLHDELIRIKSNIVLNQTLKEEKKAWTILEINYTKKRKFTFFFTKKNQFVRKQILLKKSFKVKRGYLRNKKPNIKQSLIQL